MNTADIAMGSMPAGWGEGKAKSITFCVTEDCNLACRYCYLTGKNSQKKLNIETAKKAVDFILAEKNFNDPSVIWDFIGGEPLLEIELIDQICDYIKLQMYVLDHPWFNSYRFSFTTNGLLYHSPKVQEYIRKNKAHVSISISIDGNKIKHDMQRVKPDGSGSYDDVVKNIPLWLEQFSGSSTKATFAHEDLPHIKDSILSLWELGIKNVMANFVFEDVWAAGDDEIIERQLKDLADYVLDTKMWKEYSVRFFAPHIGFPLREAEKEVNYCGAGRMLAVDCDGNLYPCVRFYDFSMNNRPGLRIGDIHRGIDQNKVRPFLALSLKSQSTRECMECEVATGCAWCQGYNYDMADTDTIYQRATAICKIHKATVRANKYFWHKFQKVTGLTSKRKIIQDERNMTKHRLDWEAGTYLQFITSDKITPHCNYQNFPGTENIMSRELVEQGLAFCEEKGLIPVMLGMPPSVDLNKDDLFVIDADRGEISLKNYLPVYDNTVNCPQNSDNSVLLVNKDSLSTISTVIQELYQNCGRINLILQDIETWAKTDIDNYELQLRSIVEFLAEAYKNKSELELNVLTDIWNLQSMRNCKAGIDSFSLAPNGRIYICPAFYFADPDSHIGTLEQGINIKNRQLFEIQNAPICSVCDVYSCRRCKFLNIKLTNEFNTPSKIQCVISHIEREQSRILQKLVMEQSAAKFDNVLKEIDYQDPLEKIQQSMFK